jgi:hypothetical protein
MYALGADGAHWGLVEPRAKQIEVIGELSDDNDMHHIARFAHLLPFVATEWSTEVDDCDLGGKLLFALADIHFVGCEPCWEWCRRRVVGAWSV